MVAAVAPTMTGLWSDRRARAEKTSRDLRADLAHAGLAEFLAKRGLEPYADGFASLGASKPSDLMHVTADDLAAMGMAPDEQAALEAHLAPLLASAAARSSAGVAAVVSPRAPGRDETSKASSWERDRRRPGRHVLHRTHALMVSTENHRTSHHTWDASSQRDATRDRLYTCM